MVESFSEELDRQFQTWVEQRDNLLRILNAAFFYKKVGDQGKLFEAAGFVRDEVGKIPTPIGKFKRQEEMMEILNRKIKIYGPQIKRSQRD